MSDHGPDVASASGPDVAGASGPDVAGASGPDVAGASGPDVGGASGPDVGGASRPDVAMVLTYYAPYVSGLTTTAVDVAAELVRRGRRVRVVTTRHDPRLPATETLDGVEVIRVPVLARLGKGVVSPGFAPRAVAEVRRARVGHLHLPLLEAGPVARAVGRATPLVMTYQCDMSLGPGVLDRLAETAILASARSALARAAAVCVSSLDYARGSRLWPVIEAASPVAVAPPCRDRSGGSPAFRDGDGPHVGFLGRIVGEKGLAVLIEAFRRIPGPTARLLIGGDYSRVAGGSVIGALRALAGDDGRVRFLGFVAEDRLADFYASLDCFVLPSVNPLEAFGIVQVEAMSAGVPVVASDRPGVRVPVTETGGGSLVPPGDASALQAGILAAVAGGRLPTETARAAISRYGVGAVVDAYESVYADVAGRPGWP